MHVKEISEANARGEKFPVPQHYKYSIYPPFKFCKSKVGEILFIEDTTTAQALIIVCSSCSERWVSSFEDFPKPEAMNNNHILLEGYIYPNLPEIEEGIQRGKAALDNFIEKRQEKWKNGEV